MGHSYLMMRSLKGEPAKEPLIIRVKAGEKLLCSQREESCMQKSDARKVILHLGKEPRLPIMQKWGN